MPELLDDRGTSYEGASVLDRSIISRIDITKAMS